MTSRDSGGYHTHEEGARERRVSVYEESPGFRLFPRVTTRIGDAQHSRGGD